MPSSTTTAPSKPRNGWRCLGPIPPPAMSRIAWRPTTGPSPARRRAWPMARSTWWALAVAGIGQAGASERPAAVQRQPGARPGLRGRPGNSRRRWSSNTAAGGTGVRRRLSGGRAGRRSPRADPCDGPDAVAVGVAVRAAARERTNSVLDGRRAEEIPPPARPVALLEAQQATARRAAKSGGVAAGRISFREAAVGKRLPPC